MTCLNCAWFPTRKTSKKLCKACTFAEAAMVRMGIACKEELELFHRLNGLKSMKRKKK